MILGTYNIWSHEEFSFRQKVSFLEQKKELWDALYHWWSQRTFLRKVYRTKTLTVEVHFQLRKTRGQFWSIICELKDPDGVYRQSNICLANMDRVSWNEHAPGRETDVGPRRAPPSCKHKNKDHGQRTVKQKHKGWLSAKAQTIHLLFLCKKYKVLVY